MKSANRYTPRVVAVAKNFRGVTPNKMGRNGMKRGNGAQAGKHTTIVFAIVLALVPNSISIFAQQPTPTPPSSAQPAAAQPAAELSDDLKRRRDSALNPDETPERRSVAVQRLLEAGKNNPAARRVVIVELLDPALAAPIRLAILAAISAHISEPSQADWFLPDYVPALLLLAHREETGETATKVVEILRHYPPQPRFQALRDAVAMALPLDENGRQIRDTAVRMMVDPNVCSLDRQLQEFVPVLIDRLNAPGIEAEFAVRLGTSLQAITEKHDIVPVTNGAAWREWWDARMKGRTPLQQVLEVHTNLRQQTARWRAELQELKLQDELRDVAANAGNPGVLIERLAGNPHPRVALRILEVLRAPVTGQTLSAAQRTALHARLQTLLASTTPTVRREAAGLAVHLEADLPIGTNGTATAVRAERLVRDRVKIEPVADVRAAMLEELGRHGREDASLETLHAALLEIAGKLRLPRLDTPRAAAELAQDMDMAQAVLRGIVAWRQFSPAMEEKTVATLREFATAVRNDRHPRLATALHNALIALNQQLDVTPVIREIFQRTADAPIFSVQFQLVTVKQGLAGKGRSALAAWLREPEQKRRLRDLLTDPQRLPFEISTTLDILAALNDPFLDPTPDAAMYAGIAAILRTPPQNDTSLRAPALQCLIAFARAEAARVPAGHEPAFLVFEMLMEQEKRPVESDVVLSALVLEHIVAQLPTEFANAHVVAIRRLRARLGIRVPAVAQEALQSYGRLIAANQIPLSLQEIDIKWAFGRPAAERDVVAPRLIAAMHPRGADDVQPSVWKFAAEALKAQIARVSYTPPVGDSVEEMRRHLANLQQLQANRRGVVAAVRALYAHAEVKRIFDTKHVALKDFYDAAEEAVADLRKAQATEWDLLMSPVRVRDTQPLPDEVRRFALASEPGITSLAGQALPRGKSVPSRDELVMPKLAARLRELPYSAALTRDVWQLILDICRRSGKAPMLPWPDEAQYAAQRTAFLTQLAEHYPLDADPR